MTSTDWLDPIEMRLWRAFLTSTSSVTAELDTQLKAATGMSIDDYDVLANLSEAPDQRLRMSELSQTVVHSRSRLTQRIDRLADQGWVKREKCEEDARGTWAVLTKQGMQTLAEAAPHHLEHVRANFIEHFTPDELEVVMTALERIANNARTQ